MADTNLINFFADFFIYDLFGNIVISVIFIILIVMAFIMIAKVPKAVLVIIPTILVMGLSQSGLVPQWVGIMLWIALGLVWGLIMKELMSM